ncbi:MAG: archaeosortase/exosortase family protein [Opitutaceae bacterium]
MPIRKQLAATLKEKVRTTDFWMHVLVYTCLFVALMPITRWVAETAEEQSRIFNALIVLGAACVLLVRFGHIEIQNPFSLNKPARYYLFAAFALMLSNLVAHQILPASNQTVAFVVPLISIPAYCCALGSLVLFTFGENTKRLTRTAAGTFCVFLLLSIFMQPLDWPLRTLAGQWSGGVLNLLGQSVEFGLNRAEESGAPQLLMFVNEHPFHVASECNGFGVILTSLVLAFMLAIYRKLGVFDIALNLLAGVILGFIFNTLRIVIIVLLAPSLMEHYHLMHEIVGAITYWGCLAIVWVSLNGPIDDEPVQVLKAENTSE